MTSQLMYKVQLLHPYGSEVIMTSEPLECMHDVREFVHWLSCQLSSTFRYRIIEFTSLDGIDYAHSHPIMEKKPTHCVYWPPQPLFLYIKKKRREERSRLGLYYEYQ